MSKSVFSSFKDRMRYSRQAVAICIAIVVWILSSASILSPVKGAIYDRFLWLSSLFQRSEAGVLLVEVDTENGNEQETTILEMIGKLDELGASSILFTFMPHGVSREFYIESMRHSIVVWGRTLTTDAFDEDVVSIAPVPVEASGLDLKYGIVDIDTAVAGIHRTQKFWHEIEGSKHFSLETAVVANSQKASIRQSESRYLINFSNGLHGLPTISHDRLLSGQLIPELVEGKCVVIGTTSGDYYYGLNTPVTPGRAKMWPLEYHGHAIHTLQSNTIRKTANASGSLLLLSVVALFEATILLWVDVTLASWITVLFVVFSFIASFCVFLYGGIWLPVAELVIIELSVFGNSIKSKAQLTGSLIRSLLLDTSAAVHKKQSRAEAARSPDHWSLIINMVNQTLDLNRAVFLEAEVGTSLLKEAKSLNCSFNDISERRRDYSRAPYITAIESGGSIRIDSYLKKAYEREEQYLTVLNYGGEILGFWALGIDQKHIAGVSSFEGVLAEYASLISELLFAKRKADLKESLRSRIEEGLTRDHIESVHDAFSETLESMASRVRQLEALLSGINTATVIYDIFGQVLHINEKMLNLLEGEKFSPNKMTALDLVSALSEYDLAKSRQILRHVIVGEQIITLNAALNGKQENRIIMHLHPLHVGSHIKSSPNLRDLTNKCILCELVDTTSFTGHYEMKQKLSNRLGYQLRNDLASIDLSSSLLADANLSENQRSHISKIIHDKVSKTMDVIVECQQYLALSNEQGNIERFPVDSQESLSEALAEVDDLLKTRNLSAVVDQPKLMSFVLASAKNLKIVFVAILKLLIGDAMDSSSVSISVSESEDLVTYHFKNAGFGIPNERFQEYIMGDKTLVSEDLKVLRESMCWVEAWGGELEAYSEVGEGTEAKIHLVKFI